MMFDITPLTATHLILLVAVFTIVFFWIAWTRQRQKSTVLAGLPIVIVSVVASALVIPEPKLYLGLVIASLVVLFIGGLDERLKLRPISQLIAQLIIISIVIAAGWIIPFVTNPISSGVIHLSSSLLLSAPLWTALWLLLMINSMNWLDGVDGLAGGVGVAAFIVLALISLLPATQDTATLSLAMIGLGVFTGFLLWNVRPAKAYLGTTGSWFLGLLLGLTAMIGGGKIATTMLVLAIPALDLLVVIISRLRQKQAPWQGDTNHHIHHRLLKRGLSPNTVVILLVGLSLAFGILAVLLHTWLKLVVIAAAGMVLIVSTLRFSDIQRFVVRQK